MPSGKVTKKGAPKDFVAQLESITKMKESGALTQVEFDTLKKKILDAQSQ